MKRSTFSDQPGSTISLKRYDSKWWFKIRHYYLSYERMKMPIISMKN